MIEPTWPFKLQSEFANCGRYTINVQLEHSGVWRLDVKRHSKNRAHRGDRGFKKFIRLVTPLVKIWAESEYKYTMNLQEFLGHTFVK